MKRTNRLLSAGALLLGLLAAALPAGAVSASAAPSGGSASDVVPFIVGGRDATEQYSAMASMQWTRDGIPNYHGCGATLIHPQFLLTNAHCTYEEANPNALPLKPEQVQVRIGSRDLRTGGVVSRVAEIFVHADWEWGVNTGPMADIALVKLSAPVSVRPYNLATPEVAPPARTTRILGWGSTAPDPQAPVYPNILQEMDISVLANEACNRGNMPITEGEICFASPAGRGACYGDSGGPGLQRVKGEWLVLGGGSRLATTAGESSNCGIRPAIYTSAAYYRGWISEVIRTGKVPPRATSAPVGTPSSAAMHRWVAGN